MSLFNMSAVKNHPRRSGFDLSNRVCFTSKAGELLPVFWDIVYPGDSFRIKTQLFTRTQPLNTAAYTRIREYLDFYFAPYGTFCSKEVVVLVELRARFDEENNIGWSRLLEDAGCQVIYGLDGYKVHSKLCLITRKNGSQRTGS